MRPVTATPQPTTSSSAAPPSPPVTTAAPVTWLEILPVFVDAGTVWRLRPRGASSWCLPYRGGAVREAALRCLASVGVEVAALHSTSWRQEGDLVLLTHLAVLPSPAGDLEGFERRRVRPGGLARGTAVSPPARIEVEHVVEHALRHLAWLIGEDPAIRLALEPGWRGPLRPYRPEPFRVFEPPSR